MKRVFKHLIIVCLFIFGGYMTSYGQAYEQGDKLLNIGIGLGGAFVTGSSTLPPVSASLEFGVTDNISAGALLGFTGSKWKGPDGSASYTYIIFGGRGSYHFNVDVDKLDPYLGLMLGYNMVSSKVTGSGYSGSIGGFTWGAHVGARYYLGEKAGIFGELGYGISYLTIGVALKL